MNFIAAVCGVATLSGCAKEVINESMPEQNSQLTVITRASDADDGTNITTPIRLYVFDEEETCVEMQTLAEDVNTLSISLPEGEYGIYAIGGADDDRLTLPSKENAKKNSEIQLKSGKQHDDLMMGHASVALAANKENQLTLGMERKVLLLKSVIIKNVPSTAEAVSISLSPMYESVLLNGNYNGESGRYTIGLTEQEEGVWKLTNPEEYLLPSVGKPTISISIDQKSYSYTCDEEFIANYKLSIEGEYTETGSSANVQLSGTITGVQWAGDKSIKFKFDENGSQKVEEEDGEEEEEDGDEEEDPVVSGNIPAVGDIYNRCYVLAVEGNSVTLLSSKEVQVFKEITLPSTNEGIVSGINTELQKYEKTEGIEEWRLPNSNEAKKIVAEQTGINATTTLFKNSPGYFYDNNGTIKGFNGTKGIFDGTINAGKNTYLRPVTTITFQQ